MATRTVTELERLLNQVEKQTVPTDEEWQAKVAQEICKVFHVKPEEVAVLELSASGKSLKFVLPQKLQAVGTIPLSSTTALAARTARDRRADIINNFATSRHASVFEGVPLSGRQGSTIQKIISVPILNGDQVAGVAQISRKGESSSEAGPDFTSKDLTELQALNSLIARFLVLRRALTPLT
jgi:hypothetical protein